MPLLGNLRNFRSGVALIRTCARASPHHGYQDGERRTDNDVALRQRARTLNHLAHPMPAELNLGRLAHRGADAMTLGTTSAGRFNASRSASAWLRRVLVRPGTEDPTHCCRGAGLLVRC